ncbi:hypothetical protein OEZ85_000568 [Tetradesmus obliquus]|uniref:Uncharacterized protein n=1 Tax=Tetradesmus obliquus TaxID=3088 RepID=A0ABY8UIM2_TETOB|nr:hypothetical protein OEZ85_000568 [Tetradesmus obliquus]WIA21342.1 hypothetical protein OEZ85_000568 [Tetradesmus obliquus]
MQCFYFMDVLSPEQRAALVKECYPYIPRIAPVMEAAAGRARPFPRHFPSSAVAARTLRLCRRSRGVVRNTQQAQEPVLPENLDLNDPELQAQITALLKELDPDLLLEDTQDLLATVAAASQGQQQQGQQQQPPHTDQPHASQQQGQQQQQQFAGEFAGAGSAAQQATAWQEEAGDDETESGLPDDIQLTRAEYKRKAAVLLELMAAQQQVNQEGGQEALQQQLSAFRGEVDAALLHMLARRLQAAQQHGQNEAELAQLQDLYDLLSLEQQRAQATPALRLLDEALDLLGDDPYMPGAKQRGEAVVQRLRAAFTGGVAEDVDIFAAAAALASDKALAAEALSVEYVPQASFLSEGMELLQGAKDEMAALAAAVSQAQTELQQVRNSQPQLLRSPEAQQHIAQVAAADEALRRRKTAVGQLAYILDIAQDLDGAERALAGSGTGGDGGISSSGAGGGFGVEQGGGRLGAAAAAAAAAPADLPSPEDLAALLGIE